MFKQGIFPLNKLLAITGKIAVQSDTFSQFVAKWASKDSGAPVEKSAIVSLEEDFGIKLPADYVEFVTRYGLPHTPALLDAITDLELDIFDIQQFEQVESVREATLAYENAGMPKGYMVFASDCMGNPFLFKRNECCDGNVTSVLVFDHDFASVEVVAASFREWLEMYTAVESAG
ncbi:SMI1/KNR4 family protein [Agarivorans sp. MS3-6]